MSSWSTANVCVWGGEGQGQALNEMTLPSLGGPGLCKVQSWISVSAVYSFQSPSVLKWSHSDLLKEVSLGEGILAKTHGFLCFLITSCTGPSGTDFIIFQASKCTSPTKGFPLIARISSPASIVPACSAAPPARTNVEETQMPRFKDAGAKSLNGKDVFPVVLGEGTIPLPPQELM